MIQDDVKGHNSLFPKGTRHIKEEVNHNSSV